MDDSDEYLLPSDIPLCACGELCDRMTATGRWYHLKCDPTSRERYERTLRMLECVFRIQRKKK